MTAQQRIVRVRRSYNRWVANQTLEDYALRFTAKKARRWSALRVANTAFGAISFLALEAIGGAITVSYGFTNAVAAILAVSALIFATGLPIAYHAAKQGLDIDLLTRGAGFGYIGSTITSLIYASFTFLFFAIEAAIMALALEMCFGIPLAVGYVVSSLLIIPVVTYGITLISRVQLWTQPLWIALHLLPFVFIAVKDLPALGDWRNYGGTIGDGSFNLIFFGMAATVTFSLIAQIGEQVDFLRFLPRDSKRRQLGWWAAFLVAGPGWIILGAVKMLAGSFLAVLAIKHLVPIDKAAEPTQMYLVAFGYVFSSPNLALAFTGAFVIVSQIKINVTNAYAGSIAWSNFFSRLTHSHPGRVVWLVFNVSIALLLMELGIYKALERILGLYSLVAVAWVGAIVADLVINRPLGLRPRQIEFKRAHLYDINPVGVGSMLIAACAAIFAYMGLFGPVAQALAPFVALVVAFVCAPLIAIATRGRYYIARQPNGTWRGQATLRCCICEYDFEPEDMASCPIYAGPICSLCCSLDARCHDGCKQDARLADQALALLGSLLPNHIVARLNSRIGHYLGIMLMVGLLIGSVLGVIYVQATIDTLAHHEAVRSTLWMVFFIFIIIAGVVVWLFVLAHESRHVAQEESQRQTTLLMQEIDAHRVTDAKLQQAKEAAEAANRAKSRYVVGISHELRTPLNAILGYAQLLERDTDIPPRRRDALRVVRRSAEHLSGLIDGLLDIARIEAGRFQLKREEIRFAEFLDQLVDMFRLQAMAKDIAFVFERPEQLPLAVQSDQKQLQQILINLLSNAIKFTERGRVTLRVRYRGQVAEFEVEDTGIGICREDIDRIFEPFERGRGQTTGGMGLGLTITKLLTHIMGGDISVTSEPGKGSLFRVKLMLAQIARPRANGDARVRRGYAGERKTILVADDDEDHRQLLHEVLSPLGFILFMAADGPSCLDLARQCQPDLVILDVSMPGMDGWEVARELRASGARNLKIVMLSANADTTKTGDADAPHDAYLMKPLAIEALLEKIGALLRLTWTEGADAIPRPSAADVLAAVKPPASSEIDGLIRLGQIGYVRGIEAKLTEIAGRTPEHGEFVAHMRGLIAEFDMDGYMRVLTELRDR